jgi:hypothetical protein
MYEFTVVVNCQKYYIASYLKRQMEKRLAKPKGRILMDIHAKKNGFETTMKSEN